MTTLREELDKINEEINLIARYGFRSSMKVVDKGLSHFVVKHFDPYSKEERANVLRRK